MALLHRPSRRIAWWVSQLPWNRWRIFGYRLLFGYEISNQATIGRGTILAAAQVKIGRAKLGKDNLFLGPFQLTVADGVSLGDQNFVECGAWALEPRFQKAGYRRECHFGTLSLITSGHFIDATGGFFLGSRAWLAGRDSQFWTHGLGPGEIRIGDNTYVGSAVRFAPGASVGANCVVGLGSVVTKSFEETQVLIAGVPAQVIKAIDRADPDHHEHE
jgi:serine acetyltransferase